jgi:hypothetical protein
MGRERSTEGVVRGQSGAEQGFCDAGGLSKAGDPLFRSSAERLIAGDRRDHDDEGIFKSRIRRFTSGYGLFMSDGSRFISCNGTFRSVDGNFITALGHENGGDGNEKARAGIENTAAKHGLQGDCTGCHLARR